MSQARGNRPTKLLRGKERADAVERLAGAFVDGARFFDALAALQGALRAVDEALTTVTLVPHVDGVNPLGAKNFEDLVEASRMLDTAKSGLFPRGEQTLATLGWSFGPIKPGETWPQRWMKIATTRPPGHPEAWPWPRTWPASVAREAALRGKRWLLETEPADAGWVQYKDGCRETIRQVHDRGASVGPWSRWLCRHRYRVARFYGTPPPAKLRPETETALRNEVGPAERMKKREQRARGRTRSR